MRADDDPEPSLPSALTIETIEVAGETLVLFDFPSGLRATPSVLTQTEQAVMKLVLRGFTTAQIAAARRVAKATISSQLQSIYRKLGVGSRTELTSKLG